MQKRNTLIILSVDALSAEEVLQKMNLNKLAMDVCEQEGGKQNLSIAQVKEVIRIVFQEFKKYKISEVIERIETTK